LITPDIENIISRYKYNNSKKTSLQLWKQFKQLYLDELNKKTHDAFKKLIDFYHEPSQRTEFNDNIISKLATNLGYAVQKEFLQIDFSLCITPSSGWPVSLIFIEHENDHEEPNELSKLCSTYALLKVFIAWHNGNWENNRSGIIEDDWIYQTSSYLEVYKNLDGILGIIIISYNQDKKLLTYYIESLDEIKKEFVNEGILFEVQL
jgi:hypothetical protein